MLHPADFKHAILAIDALGSTPAILAKVAALAKDPNTDLEILGALLKNDGALAADIIRISNSAMYAPETPHSNLTSALNQIGLREVLRVVNLSLSRQLLARDLNSYGVSAQDYWTASVAAALVMEALARHAGLNADDAYTIGILHAIGYVLINRVIDDKGFTLYWDTQQPIEQWERASVGFDHAEAGALLLEHWHFPAATCDVIRWQLDPGKVAAQASLLGALQFAQRLLALTGLDFSCADWQFPAQDPFVQATGLTAETAAELVAGCRVDLARILKTVGMN